MKSTKLNFINRSDDSGDTCVVIFQKNSSTRFDGLTIAWKVIKNCGQGDYHPFTYQYDMQVNSGDSYGNFTYPQTAYPGDRFDMVLDRSGNRLQRSSQRAVTASSVEVFNDLSIGSILANIYRSGELLATENVVAPGQKAVFDFKPCIYVGVASEIEQGQVINADVLSQISTQIYLTGVLSADLIMTGGRSGSNPTPFQFTLENVVYA